MTTPSLQKLSADKEPRPRGRPAGAVARAPGRLAWLLLAFLCLQSPDLIAAQSQCYGTVSNGRLERGVKLPGNGANFTSYSALGAAAGRTYVHSKVAEIISSAYAALAKENPSVIYVYGETGWSSGGRIRPHRTHQNGLSVDFFVPVRDAAGRSVPLPTSVVNKLGYDIEFNANARYEEYAIDFEATAEHLYQLHLAAKANGAGIALVIFDTAFLPKLFATTRGKYLQKELPFMQGKPWVRHDEHYHIDFSVPCKQDAG
jgi:penicillin-insensitive murein endopeptidase